MWLTQRSCPAMASQELHRTTIYTMAVKKNRIASPTALETAPKYPHPATTELALAPTPTSSCHVMSKMRAELTDVTYTSPACCNNGVERARLRSS